MGSAIGQIHIVLVDGSRLVTDMVEQAIEGERDIVVLGRVGTVEAAESLAVGAEAVVVVASNASTLARDCVRMLRHRSRLKVIGLDTRAGEASLYERVALGEVSPDAVVDSIREAVRRPTALAGVGRRATLEERR